ncbi:hypothetical protein [Chroococcus sp. FPU101]|uniref:hypothetical protein n=1 Tax=Chroococcus sp. FPU101 TaxID=1974212 RepID=UPI001A8F28E4|nr:hypothetical protein [Chroococcus sp. FPU101]GFE72062.1 hypothetical protein CFPU101_46720 [Chroococcus sp. FPU101]
MMFFQSNVPKLKLSAKQKKLTTLGLIVAAILSPTAVFAFNSSFIDLANKLSGGWTGEALDLYKEVKGYVEDITNSDGRELLQLVLDKYMGTCNGSNNQYITAPEGLCGQLTADGSKLGDLLETARGTLNIPIPLDYQKEIRYELEQSNKLPVWGYYTNSGQVQGLAMNAGDRGVTALHADTILGEDGQQQVSDSLENAAEVTQSILETGEEALKAESTQDAVKILAWTTAQQAILAQQQVKDGQMSRVDSQIANLNLSNISETLDEQRSDRYAKERVNVEGFVNAATRAGLF